VDVEAPSGERGNIQTGGDRVSTISLLGCSTSVALAVGPADEEEEEQHMKNAIDTIRFISAIIVDCLDRKYWTQYELH